MASSSSRGPPCTNGECTQICDATGAPATTCDCLPWFQLDLNDARSCTPRGDVVVATAARERFLDLTPAAAPSRKLEFRPDGRAVKMEQVAGLPNGFTFTVQQAPGTCADGSTNAACIDEYRLCATDADSLFTTRTLWKSARAGSPSGWNGPACTWLVEQVGGNDVRLKNLWFQQTRPYVDYLACDAAGCGFTIDEAVPGSTTFNIDIDNDRCANGTAGCSPDALCTHTAAGTACTCKSGFEGSGTTCTRFDPCQHNNGGCAQTCVRDVATDSAICGCATGFNLAGNGTSCQPVAGAQLYNVGLDRFIGTNGGFNATTGRQVAITPVPGDRAYTFDTTDGGYTYRLCTYNGAGWQAFSLMRAAGAPAPYDWDRPTCAWDVYDAGGGQIRLKNAWNRAPGGDPSMDYLDCVDTNYCFFTTGESVAGNTLFKVIEDRCVSGALTCGGHGQCGTGSAGSACVCDVGYSFDGQTCVLTDICAINNGGCAQRCLETLPDGTARCGCVAGNVPDMTGNICTPAPGARLHNEGLAAYFGLFPNGGTPSRFQFQAGGSDVRIGTATTGNGDLTFDIQYTPGLCADGSTSAACPETYRLCAVRSGGYQAYLVRSDALYGQPSDWNTTACAWRPTQLGNGRIYLENREVTAYFGSPLYMGCEFTDFCRFYLPNEVTANNIFALDVDECATGANTCSPNADCTDTTTSYSCACRTGFAGDGQTCRPTDACVLNNGGCDQRCVGTTAALEGVCECYPGFNLAADGHTCEPWGGQRLANVGLDKYLDLNTTTLPPYPFEFTTDGRNVALQQVPGSNNQFTITVANSPGYCADGRSSVLCPDLTRLCATGASGYRWTKVARDARVGDPALWNGPECRWTFTELGGGTFRMKNVWVQQVAPHADWLECATAGDCIFTLDEATAGNTVFAVSLDECTAGTDACDVNATCTDTRAGYQCTCQAGFSGDGRTCAVSDACVRNNGQCAQRCVGTTAQGTGQCACFAGFTLAADGKGCEAVPSVKLYNVGLDKALGVRKLDSNAGSTLAFQGAGRNVRMEPTADGPDTFTFTVDVTPGTCANGSQLPTCVDSYRMCATQAAGFRWSTVLRNPQTGKPALWDAPDCKWRVEDAGNGQVHLKNLWLQERFPYADFLTCVESPPNFEDCFFTFDEALYGNPVFRIDVDQCANGTAVCDPHATCRDQADGYTCQCNAQYVGNGVTCAPDNACVVNNGGCQQSCIPNGAAATCGCFPGFVPAADGHSCAPVPAVRMVSRALNAAVGLSSTGALDVVGNGLPMHVAQNAAAPNAVTLTMDQRPGTCADGSTSNACLDEFRICADTSNGFGWKALKRTATSGTPAGWDGADCTWLIEVAFDSTFRLKNLGIQQSFPYIDYLECAQPSDCGFTFEERVEWASYFDFDSDECAAASSGCDANATCANLAGGGHSCTCGVGYAGTGQQCVLVDGCLINNGGCQQACRFQNNAVDCRCWPGFAPNGAGGACVPVAPVRLFNQGIGLPFDVAADGYPPYELALLNPGGEVQMLPVNGAPNTYTFTVAYAPGLCADGTSSMACQDEYRLCAHSQSGFRHTTLRHLVGEAPPVGWDAPACQWLVVPAGGDRLRLRNVGLDAAYPFINYLNCNRLDDCTFTYGDVNAATAVFVVDADECGLNTDTCGQHATCTNTMDGYACACEADFHGDGITCAPDNACVIGNGGCGQKCSAPGGGGAVCGCYPGFTLNADGHTCDSIGTVVLHNTGLGLSMNIAGFFLESAPFAFQFTPAGRGLRMEPSLAGIQSGRHDTFTFTVDYVPGTCADGQTRPECTDQYRLCAGESSGFRWDSAWKHAGGATPATWDAPECAWIVEEAGSGQFRLKNLWLQETYPYVDYLQCSRWYQCGFTSDNSTVGNTAFILLTDACATGQNSCSNLRACLNAGASYVCADCPLGWRNNGAYACDDIDDCVAGYPNDCAANATCTNTPGSYTCTCNEGLAGDGRTCAIAAECATNNGGCAQTCVGASGAAVCSCLPGFTLAADGKACNSIGDIKVSNVGLGMWLSVDTAFGPPDRLGFSTAGTTVAMEPVATARDHFTFTARFRPGTCPDGSTSDACTDSYRLCATQSSGFRWNTLHKTQAGAAPADWNSSKCTWKVRRAGDDQIQLRSAWLEESYPYYDFLECPAEGSCTFTLDGDSAGHNITFRVVPAGATGCEGVVCVARNSCYAAGVCQPSSGECSEPVLPVGTPCDDGNNATQADTCTAGRCIGGGDRDGDGVSNALDLCIGDDATGDSDGDGRCDDSDNCTTRANASQVDSDGDGYGDLCDNCPNTVAASQADADGDGIGNACDPDYQPPSLGPDSNSPYNGGNAARPACGFTPVCPGKPNATRYNSYMFGCYADEPNGGVNCLGDRWHHHLRHRIYPAIVSATGTDNVDGILNELAMPENNVPAVACQSTATCTSPATCEGGVCTMPAVKDFIDRLADSSAFLSCTGANSYEMTWPEDRILHLDTGTCDPLRQRWNVYGYKVSNTMAEPMTIWVAKSRGEFPRWWTINPGEEIRFNVYEGALLFATTAAAYHACEPDFMRKTVTTANLVAARPSVGTGYGMLSIPQTTPAELVRYTVDFGGSLVITRERELTTDFHLYVYPNYFGVGLSAMGQYNDGDMARIMAKLLLLRTVPDKEGGERVISGERYPVLDCTP